MAAPESHPPIPFQSLDNCAPLEQTVTIENPEGINLAQAFDGQSEPAKGLHLKLGFDSIAERRKIFEWLGAGLRPGRPGRLQQEYPLLFKDNASVFHSTLYQGSELSAFCTLWAVHFRIGVHQLRAGLISSVYTDPKTRGRGHASRVVHHALEKARNLNLGLGLLWSDIDSLYTRLGFVEAGAESLLLIDQATLHSATQKLRAAKGGDTIRIDLPGIEEWQVIERLRRDRACQLELDSDELSTMRSIPDMCVRVARKGKPNPSNGGEDIVAFAIRRRGDDFREVIHEWAGEPEATLRCFQSLLEDCGPHNGLFLLTPPDEAEVPWQLRKAGARVIQKPLAWMRVLSTSAFAEDLSRIVPGSTRIRIHEVPHRIETPTGAPDLTIKTTKGELTLDQSTFLRLVLGPGPRIPAGEPSRRFSELRSRKLTSILDDAALEALPLPFFVWGMESV